MNDRSTILLITIGAVLISFLVAYGLNAAGQWKEHKTYLPPSDLVDIIKIVIGSVVATLSWAGLAGGRKTIENGHSDDKKSDGQLPDSKK